jgi:NADH:ubiquinone oxidoreductase subunit 6 (subunit J)
MNHAVSPFFFYVFAAVSVLPGIFVLATKDIVRAAFWLLTALSGFAGLYVLLGADFLAVTQVVVYLGGILILILFGVMLTHRDPALVRRARRLNIVVPGIAGGVTLAAAVAAAGTRAHFAVATVSLAAISPTHDVAGKAVTLSGANLAEVTTVTFNGVPLANLVTNADGSSLSGIVPEGHGLVTVALETKHAGTLTAEHAWAYGEEAHPDFRPVSRVLPLPEEDFRGTTQDIGTLLVASNDEPKKDVHPAEIRSYLLPFEIASVLLLAALVGAAYIARRGGEHEQYEGTEEGHLHG